MSVHCGTSCKRGLSVHQGTFRLSTKLLSFGRCHPSPVVVLYIQPFRVIVYTYGSYIPRDLIRFFTSSPPPVTYILPLSKYVHTPPHSYVIYRQRLFTFYLIYRAGVVVVNDEPEKSVGAKKIR